MSALAAQAAAAAAVRPPRHLTCGAAYRGRGPARKETPRPLHRSARWQAALCHASAYRLCAARRGTPVVPQHGLPDHRACASSWNVFTCVNGATGYTACMQGDQCHHPPLPSSISSRTSSGSCEKSCADMLTERALKRLVSDATRTCTTLHASSTSTAQRRLLTSRQTTTCLQAGHSASVVLLTRAYTCPCTVTFRGQCDVLPANSAKLPATPRTAGCSCRDRQSLLFVHSQSRSGAAHVSISSCVQWCQAPFTHLAAQQILYRQQGHTPPTL